MKRDPRVTSYARQWLTAPPVRGARRPSFFLALIELLAETKDVRIRDLILELSKPSTRPRSVHAYSLKAWKPLVELGQSLLTIKPTPLDAADRDLLSRIGALTAKMQKPSAELDPTELYANVYRAPDDDDARAVLGDLLQQKGDPHGEFIALQLARHRGAGKRTSRERELAEQWGRTWLGKIEPAVLKSGVVFERGFVARARYAGGSAGSSTIHCDEWATVTHLDVSTASGFMAGSHELLLAPQLLCLRHVEGIGERDLVELVKHRLSWKTFGLALWRWAALEPLLKEPQSVIPDAERLVITHAASNALDVRADQLRAVVAALPKLTEVDVLVARATGIELARSQEIGRLDRFVVRYPNFHYAIERATRRLAITFDSLRAEWATEACAFVRQIAETKLVERVEVSAPGRVKIEPRDVLARGSWERLSLAELRATALRGGLDLKVLV